MLLQEYPSMGNVDVRDGVSAERGWGKNYQLSGWFDNVKEALKGGVKKVVSKKLKPAVQRAAVKEVQKAVAKVVKRGDKYLKITTQPSGQTTEVPATQREVLMAKATGAGLKIGLPLLIGGGILAAVLLRGKK